MRTFTLVSLAALVTYTGTAAAGPKKKKAPPPPVPAYWIGAFWSDETHEGTAGTGTVTVKAEGAPAEAILVAPYDTKHLVTTATGAPIDGKPGTGYAATYVAPPEVLTSWPTVIVLDAASGLKPVLISKKAAKSTLNKLRKRLIKEIEKDELSYWDGTLVDLDADGVGDIALFFGCMGGIDGVCAGNSNFFYVRDGKDWTSIYIEE